MSIGLENANKCINEIPERYRAEVKDARIRKPFLGGWCHKITRLEYLNAESQTGPHRMPSENACSAAAVQYVAEKNASTQTLRTSSTQMCRRDYYVPCETDRYLKAQPYETFEERQRRLDLDGNARIIQRNYRAYRVRKFSKESAEEYRELVRNYEEFKEGQARMNRERHRRELIRKMHPKSRSDFDMLYELIEKWRQERLGCSKIRFLKAGRCAENNEILQKTVEMYRAIEGKRTVVKRDYHHRKRAKFLAWHCKPLKWRGYRNLKIELVTMRVQRARELKAIYEAMLDNNVTSQERLALVLSLRSTIDSHNCIGAVNLTRLLDQEIQLLAREVDGLKLDYLRERIIYSYLWFVRASDECGCNDGNKEEKGAAGKSGKEEQQAKEDQLREPLEVRTKLCKSCLKLVPQQRFAVHSRMRRLSVCVGCTWLERRNLANKIYNPYTFILNSIRSEETRKRAASALAFMMQEQDIFHLVNNIWHGHSIVSENKDVYILRLVRYRREEEWSPWNCILLTEEEAEAHVNMKDLASLYSKHLRHRVFLAQQLAKNHFKQLSMFEQNFRESPLYAATWDGEADDIDATCLRPMKSVEACGVESSS